MILIDTSVWADHFRKTDIQLVGLLSQGRVLVHPHVTGELAMGTLDPWRMTVEMLCSLPQMLLASESELLIFIEEMQLPGSGIGFVDAHLLAACRLRPGSSLWTRDKKLATCANAMDIGWSPSDGE